MHDPREIYPGEPNTSILSRLSGHGRPHVRDNSSVPIPGWLFVAIMIGIPAFGIAMFTVDQLIVRGFFG